jgi:CRP-like cAMP-binding protein
MESVIEKEELVRNYLDQGNKEAAIKQLFDLVVACAKEKNFEAAEAMRSRIFEIDEMALSEIIRSGEIIEEEKRQAIDGDHLEIWTKLYDSLSVEEANALYFAFTKANYQTGETIFKQGEWKPRLYFIDTGRAKLVYFRDGREVFLKAVEPGQFAGDDAFFAFTLCTATMIALSRIEARYLDSEILKVWRTTAPALESKLQTFASSTEKIADLLEAAEIDRRRYKRVDAVGKAIVQLMSLSEDPVGNPFKVDVCNISRGGVSFLVRITKRERASQLFGKRLRVSYVHPRMDSAHVISQSGTIVAIHFPLLEDCAVDVEFDELLPEALIKQLEKLSPSLQDFDF